MSRSYDIFLSHSGAQKDFVEHLNAELVRVCGNYSVFFDRDAIEHGEQISTSILEYARTCKLAVAVVSEEYFTRSRPPMMELAASYTAAKAGNGFPSLPCLLPVFLALRPEDAKDSSTQSEWRKVWQKWEVNEKMSERRKSRPRRVQPTVWKEAVDRLLDTRGPIYIPEEYGYDPEVFMKKVAQVIARKLDDLNGGVGPSKVGEWEVNEKMSERRKSRPRRVQPTIWKEAADRLLDTRGPIYIPEEYGYDPEVFMKKVAQVIARKLDDLNGGVGPSKVGDQLMPSYKEVGHSGDTGVEEDSSESSGLDSGLVFNPVLGSGSGRVAGKVTDEKESLPEPYNVVVGLEFGSTYSSFSYSHINDPEVIYMFCFYPKSRKANYLPSCRTVTGIYYSSRDGGQSYQVESWGNPARSYYEEIEQNDTGIYYSSRDGGQTYQVESWGNPARSYYEEIEQNDTGIYYSSRDGGQSYQVESWGNPARSYYEEIEQNDTGIYYSSRDGGQSYQVESSGNPARSYYEEIEQNDTGIYYSSRDGGQSYQVESSGNPARSYYEEIEQNDGRSREKFWGIYVTRFNPHLKVCDMQISTTRKLKFPYGLPVDRPITDYLHEFGAYILHVLQKRFGPDLTMKMIQWCVPVPSSWDNAAREKMKTCMESAGLINGADGSPYPVKMVGEREAASLESLKHSQLQRKVGDKLLVVDIGESFFDVVVQEVVSVCNHIHRVKEVSSSLFTRHSSPDRKFLRLLHRKFGRACLQELQTEHPTEYEDLIGQWDSLKYEFGYVPGHATRIGEPIQIQVPRELGTLERYMRHSVPVSDRYSEELVKIEIPCREFELLFDPVIEELRSCISSTLLVVGGVRSLVLVGDWLAVSPYVLDNIRRRFKWQVPEITSPPNLSSATCKGAVALAQDLCHGSSSMA